MNEEIMNNEEIMEANEEVTTRKPMTGLEKAGGVALLALAGIGVYKIGKAIAKKVKKNKAAKAACTHEGEYTEESCDEVED